MIYKYLNYSWYPNLLVIGYDLYETFLSDYYQIVCYSMSFIGNLDYHPLSFDLPANNWASDMGLRAMICHCHSSCLKILQIQCPC